MGHTVNAEVGSAEAGVALDGWGKTFQDGLPSAAPINFDACDGGNDDGDVDEKKRAKLERQRLAKIAKEEKEKLVLETPKTPEQKEADTKKKFAEKVDNWSKFLKGDETKIRLVSRELKEARIKHSEGPPPGVGCFCVGGDCNVSNPRANYLLFGVLSFGALALWFPWIPFGPLVPLGSPRAPNWHVGSLGCPSLPFAFWFLDLYGGHLEALKKDATNLRETAMQLDDMFESNEPRSKIMAFMRDCTPKIKEAKENMDSAQKRVNPNHKAIKTKTQKD